MKHLLLLLFSLCFVAKVSAQSTPFGMKYQAVARNAEGGIIADKAISIQMSLVSNSASAKQKVYSELHEVVTNKFGLFDLTVGEGNSILGDFKAVPWSSDEIWLEIALDEDHADKYMVISSSRLLTVPYAFHAMTASSIVEKEGDIRRGGASGVPSSVWSLKGNQRVDDAVDRLGTTDCADLVIVTDNQERMRILCSGEIEMVTDLNVQGDTKFDGDLEVTGDGSFSNIDVSEGLQAKNIAALENINSEYLTVGINAYLYALEVENNAIIYNDLDVGNNIQSNSLDIAGTATAGSVISPYLTATVNAYLNALQVENNAIIYNDLDVGNNIQSNSLDIAGNTTTGTLIVKNGARLEQDIEVSGNATLGGDLNVLGATNFDGSVSSTGDGSFENLTVTNNTSTGTLDVGGTTNTSTLNVSGGTNTASLSVNSSTTTNSLIVNGSADVQGLVKAGTLDVTGGGSFFSLGTTNNANIGQDLTVSRNVSVGNNIGTTFLNATKDVNAGQDLGVGRDADINGALSAAVLSVAGNGSFFSLGTTNNANIGQDLTVSRNVSVGNNIGTTFLNATKDVNAGQDLRVQRNAFINGSLTVNDPAVLNKSLVVSGPTTLQELNVEEDVVVPNILVNEELEVTNNATFSSDILAKKCLSIGTGNVAKFKFTPSLTNTSESSFGNYPLQISGSTQGMAINVNGWFQSRNFMAFFADGNMQGRIEGKRGFLFQALDSQAKNLLNFSGTGNPAGVDGDPNAAASNEVNKPIPTTQLSVGANTEELVDYIILATKFLGSAITLVTSLTSVLDPFDIFEAGLGLAISAADLGVFVGFGFANVGVAYESGSGDYAEWLRKDDTEESMTFGDIVGVIGGRISKNFEDAEKFMVVSGAPAVIGAMPSSASEEVNYEKVAFIGQVPVKVRGLVSIGDYILPSGEGDGLAIAVSKDMMQAKDYGRIIGVAWEASKEEDEKKMYQMINTAVGINQNDIAEVVDQMQIVMNQMQDAIKELNPNFEKYAFNTNGSELNRKQDYSVANYHETNMMNYFDGKKYNSQEELGMIVADALQSQAGINLDEYPVLKRILLEPAFADEALAHYSKVLQEHLTLLEELKAD